MAMSSVSVDYFLTATSLRLPPQILARIPAATLWLLAWPGIEPHLRREARARRLEDRRLVLTPMLPAETHIRWKVC